MIRPSLAALAIATATTASPAAALRYAPLAPELAAPIPSPPKSVTAAWASLGAAEAENRQKRRWDLALALLAEDRHDEARGVLAVLAADEPDLRLVRAWRIAAGRAAAELGFFSETIALLDEPRLNASSEACAWRLLALTGLGGARAALAQLPCAKPYLARLSPQARGPFLWAAARAALAIDRPDAARISFASPRPAPTTPG